MIEVFLALLFKLICGHALADFALQPEAMGKGKNRNRQIDTSLIPPGAKYVACWPYWLSSHALIHGGVVMLITGSIVLGLAESVCHWIIDFFKCENKYGVHTDQALHISCKVLWVIFWMV